MPWADVECHSSVRKALTRSIEKGMLNTTHLIYGPSGAGQESVARAIAMTVNCKARANDFCGVCNNCRRIAERVFPDVFIMRPQEDWSDKDRKGKDYSIDHLREMQRVAQSQPYEAEKKIFILTAAHRMQEAAANCLLKTLEEPYSHTLFLLLTDNLAGILPTILSRSRKVRLLPLEIQTLAEKLRRELPEAPAQTLAMAAGGLYERALELWRGGYLEKRDETLDLLQNLLRRPSAAVEKVEPLVKEKDTLRERLVILLGLLRDGVILKDAPDAEPLLNPDKKSEMLEMLVSTKPTVLIRCSEKICEVLEGMDRNVNPTLLLTDLFLSFQS